MRSWRGVGIIHIKLKGDIGVIGVATGDEGGDAPPPSLLHPDIERVYILLFADFEILAPLQNVQAICR